MRRLLIAANLVVTQGLLKVLRFNRTRRVLQRWPVPAINSLGAVGDELIRVSHARPLVVIGIDCVAESLLLEAMLRRSGEQPHLRIGVDPTNPSSAHAWVEVDGAVINDTDDVAQRWAAFGDEIPMN